MKKAAFMRLRFLAACALIAAVAGAHASPAHAASKATYYLSLGDSLAQGSQPIGGPASSVAPPGYAQGYADQLLKLERGSYAQLQLVKLGCGGESTVSMLYGSQDPSVALSCGPPSFYEARYPDGGTQLAAAVAFLQEHRGSVAFVTIDIGANDVLGPSGLGPALSNLAVILAALREAAGDSVPIVGMNYYDPFAPQAWSQGGLSALQAQVAGIVAINDALESVYAAAGDPVADVESAFAVTDLRPVGATPLDVLRECQWTWICAPPPLGPDIHANTDGYGVIARAFETALP
jgi:lysophospholipase L1-like esterase